MLFIHRTFLTRAYPTMKKNNPHTPILIREAAGTIPKIYARYGSSSSCLSPASSVTPLFEKTPGRAWKRGGGGG